MQFSCDFETTTDENDCRVWAFACCEIGDVDNFIYGNSLDAFMKWCANGKKNYKNRKRKRKMNGLQSSKIRKQEAPSCGGL